MRFIPTCVGNTSNAEALALYSTVHPHVCGEHALSVQVMGGWCGSSPRVWGTPLPMGIAGRSGRFIPTCVGNTEQLQAVQKTIPVHPHVCGEHHIKIPCLQARNGSSPRVWGTLTKCPLAQAEIRFIPTCVGNTDTHNLRSLCHAVHPHVCGEHSPSSHPAPSDSGSSPRVWGTLPAPAAP